MPRYQFIPFPEKKVPIRTPFVHMATSQWCNVSLPPSSHPKHQCTSDQPLIGFPSMIPANQTAFEVRTIELISGVRIRFCFPTRPRNRKAQNRLYHLPPCSLQLAFRPLSLSSKPMASRALLLSSTFPSSKQRFFHIRPENQLNPLLPSTRINGNHVRLQAVQESKEETKASIEEATEKYGLEFGLWKIFSSKEQDEGGKEKSKTDQAKELLAKYGGAYLATSITLSIISFTLCYLLVSAGIDVQSLLNKIGIATDETGGKVGTFALAYAAHKAASPIRFPPTVALTPIVANWIGKKTTTDNK